MAVPATQQATSNALPSVLPGDLADQAMLTAVTSQQAGSGSRWRD